MQATNNSIIGCNLIYLTVGMRINCFNTSQKFFAIIIIVIYCSIYNNALFKYYLLTWQLINKLKTKYVIYLPQVILNLLNYCFKLTISRFHIRIGRSWIIVSINFVPNHSTDTCFIVKAIWMGLIDSYTELIIGFVLHVNTGTIFGTVWLL